MALSRTRQGGSPDVGEPGSSEAPSLADRGALLAAALLFSTGGAVIKSTSLDAWELAGWRAAVAWLALWLILPGPVAWRSPAVLLTGVAQGATMLLFVLSNKTTTAANAIFLQSTGPLYLPLLARALLGERAAKADYVAMAGIAVGMTLFFVGAAEPTATAPAPRLGDALAIASGCTWALTVVGLRYLARDGRSGGGTTKGAVLWANAFVAVVGLGLGGVSSTPSGVDAIAIAYLGAVQVGFGYRMLVRGIARVPALEASLLILFEPVLNPVWAYLFLAESPSAWALAGAGVLAAVTVGRAFVAHSR